jgi:type I restriction enzyme, S subunit
MSFSASIEELVKASTSDLVGAAPWWGRIPLGYVANILNGYP